MENNGYYDSLLKRYIRENHICCEHLVFSESCHSVGRGGPGRRSNSPGLH
jgi:hypothetical protein